MVCRVAILNEWYLTHCMCVGCTLLHKPSPSLPARGRYSEMPERLLLGMSDFQQLSPCAAAQLSAAWFLSNWYFSLFPKSREWTRYEAHKAVQLQMLNSRHFRNTACRSNCSNANRTTIDRHREMSSAVFFSRSSSSSSSLFTFLFNWVGVVHSSAELLVSFSFSLCGVYVGLRN